jgi:hypothetical protein
MMLGEKGGGGEGVLGMIRWFAWMIDRWFVDFGFCTCTCETKEGM